MARSKPPPRQSMFSERAERRALSYVYCIHCPLVPGVLIRFSGPTMRCMQQLSSAEQPENRHFLQFFSLAGAFSVFFVIPEGLPPPQFVVTLMALQSTTTKASTARSRTYRDKLKAQGYAPVTVWCPPELVDAIEAAWRGGPFKSRAEFMLYYLMKEFLNREPDQESPEKGQTAKD